MNAVQTFVEPDSLLVHLVDENSLKRINAPNPTNYKSTIDVRLRLNDGTWATTE